MKSYSFLITVITFLFSWSANASLINNPEQNLLSRIAHEPNCLWKLQADLNADGYPEILLSLKTLRNGDAGNAWIVYAGRKNGYLLLDENLSFRTDAVFIGYIEEIKDNGLLGYYPDNSSQGALIALQLKQTRFNTIKLGVIRPLGEDAQIYNKYFSSSKLNLEKKSIYDGKC
jgi:hypothetical protein